MHISVCLQEKEYQKKMISGVKSKPKEEKEGISWTI
jgi:hypothetical protein